MPVWRDILDAIVAKLKGVSGIGQVYDHPINLRDPTRFKEAATVTDPTTGKRIINIWFVERTAATDLRGGEAPRVGLSQAVRRETFRIIGLYSFAKDGATIFDFNNLIENILEAFLPAITLGNPSWLARALDVRTIDYREFGEVLCHFTVIYLVVEWRKPAINYV